MKKPPQKEQFDKAWAMAVKPDNARADLEDFRAELTKINADIGRLVLSGKRRRELEKRRTLLEIKAEAQPKLIRKFEQQAAEYGTPGAKRPVMARDRAILQAALEEFRQGAATTSEVIKRLDQRGLTANHRSPVGKVLDERHIRTILERLVGKRKPGRPKK